MKMFKAFEYQSTPPGRRTVIVHPKEPDYIKVVKLANLTNRSIADTLLALAIDRLR